MDRKILLFVAVTVEDPGCSPDANPVHQKRNARFPSHQMDWVRACKERPENRLETASPFSEAGPFNEMVVMGVLAVRLQSLNQELYWDGEKMQFTNIPSDATIRTIVEDGFKITDGHPTFNKTWTDRVSAIEYANEMIKHTYKNGWKLPDMP